MTPTASPLQLFAFDLDGTLVNSEAVNVPDMIEFLNAEYQVPITEEQWFAPQGYHGLAGAALFSKLHADFGIHVDAAEFMPRRNARLPAIWARQGLSSAPGVVPVLAALHTSGRQVCIATNSTPERLRLSLGHAQPSVAPYFGENLFSGQDTATDPHRKPKPAPDVYLAAAHAYNLNPSQCLAIEDSPVGALAALTAGFVTVAYLGLSRYPERDAEEMRKLGVTHIIHHWDEFLPLLERLETPVHPPAGHFSGQANNPS